MRSLVAAALLTALVATVAHAQDLRATAAAKLERGGLQRWERNWWQKIAAGTIAPKPVTVWATSYGPWEGYAGDDYHVAANPQYMPLGTVLYVPLTGRLMVVTNRGAGYNDRIAHSRNAAHWLDLWSRRAGQYGLGCKVTRVYVIGRAPWPH